MALTTIQQSILQRKLRGASWAAEGDNVFIASGERTYKVRSYNSPAHWHYVTFAPRVSCDCFDFKKHEATTGTCRHIEAARVYDRAITAIVERGFDEMEFRYRLEDSAPKTRYQAYCWTVLASLIRDHRWAQAQRAA